MKEKVILAYSGGLDTTAIIPWLKENYDYEVICCCIDCGQEEELDGLEERAISCGASKLYIVDIIDEFCDDYIMPCVQANAIYENKYLLGTSMARPLIAKKLVEIARKEGATAICHGATGKGNDQIRFELGIKALAPDLKIIAAWRDSKWTMDSRESEIEYCKAHGIHLPFSADTSYSRDRNIWHISHEGLELEDPANEPNYDHLLVLGVSPEKAPDEAEYVSLTFEKGRPVAINGEKMKASDILRKLNKLGGKHGIGIVDIVENRVVGMKSRGVYETPAGSLIYYAHNELENLCLLLPEQDQLVLRGKYSCEEGWQQLDMELSLPPTDTPLLTDTYDGVQVQLEGTQATITLSPAPKTDQWGDIGIRVEQEHSYPILGAYNEYVDVCIGEQEDGFFRPVVYLLTKDGVVEYVDVLRCLMFGNAMICQDPIYFANNGVALERSGSEVNLRRADGSVLELAPLSAEWSAQEIPYSVTGSYNYTSETGWNWLDLGSDGSVQLGVQDNSRIYRGDAAYLGVVPEGVVLGIAADEELEFVAAFKNDLYNENLTLTMIAGQNPFAEGETQLQLTRSYG